LGLVREGLVLFLFVLGYWWSCLMGNIPLREEDDPILSYVDGKFPVKGTL